jgi:hypothetical protein
MLLIPYGFTNHLACGRLYETTISHEGSTLDHYGSGWGPAGGGIGDQRGERSPLNGLGRSGRHSLNRKLHVDNVAVADLLEGGDRFDGRVCVTAHPAQRVLQVVPTQVIPILPARRRLRFRRS